MPRRPAPFRAEPLEDRLAPAAGDLDLSFGTVGTFAKEFPGTAGSWAGEIAIQPGGKIILAGRVNGDFAAMRLNLDGSIDPTFGTAGLTQNNLTGWDDV